MEFLEDFVLELPKIDPRGDISGVDPLAVDLHVAAIGEILQADKDEYQIADLLRAYVREHLYPDPPLYFVVNDTLASRKVITKSQLKNYLSLVLLIE